MSTKKRGNKFKIGAMAVLSVAERPLSAKELCSEMIEKGVLVTTGKTPWNSVAATIYMDIKNLGDESPFVVPIPGRFALKDNVCLESFDLSSPGDGKQQMPRIRVENVLPLKTPILGQEKPVEKELVKEKKRKREEPAYKIWKRRKVNQTPLPVVVEPLKPFQPNPKEDFLLQRKNHLNHLLRHYQNKAYNHECIIKEYYDLFIEVRDKEFGGNRPVAADQDAETCKPVRRNIPQKYVLHPRGAPVKLDKPVSKHDKDNLLCQRGLCQSQRLIGSNYCSECICYDRNQNLYVLIDSKPQVRK